MKLFPATDSEAVKREFIEMFGSHVLTSGVEADRNSREGLVDGLAELWTLSRTCKIYGSLGSTFSQMAAYIGGKKKELIYLRKDSPGRLSKNTRVK